MEYYIRFGEIPEDGFSKIHHGDAIMGLEPGVSVYDCSQKRGKWMICIPNPMHPFTLDTLKGFETDVIESADKKIYLITGTYVGVGSDGEPCLKDVQIIKDITDEFQMDYREYSFIPKDWVTKNIYLHKNKSSVVFLQMKLIKKIARGNSLAISFSPFGSTSLYRDLLRKEEYLIYG